MSADLPPGFLDRIDDAPDSVFYDPDRFVTHIDHGAIESVGALYEELELTGRVLDLMSSWISHFRTPPAELVALGMNPRELAANEAATSWLVHDLNRDPEIPFDDDRFDQVVCCVSVDYLTRPIEVFRSVQRVLVPGGAFVVTFSNRCFPTKVVRGWMAADDAGRCRIVADYFTRAGGFEEPVIETRRPAALRSDPLYAVWSRSLE